MIVGAPILRATNGYDGDFMRGSKALNLIPADQIDERSMQPQSAKVDSATADIKLDIRELRADVKAANESISDLRSAIATMDGKINALNARVDANAVDLRHRLLHGRSA